MALNRPTVPGEEQVLHLAVLSEVQVAPECTLGPIAEPLRHGAIRRGSLVLWAFDEVSIHGDDRLHVRLEHLGPFPWATSEQIQEEDADEAGRCQHQALVRNLTTDDEAPVICKYIYIYTYIYREREEKNNIE